MTRINPGVLPEEIPNKQLLSEHREMKRIPNKVASGKANLDGCPEKFTLNTGHVRFFYHRLGYLLGRYIAVYLECRRRGFNVQCYVDAWKDIPEHLMGMWHPTHEDRMIILERFKERGIELIRPGD